jgi:hypothetical protein
MLAIVSASTNGVRGAELLLLHHHLAGARIDEPLHLLAAASDDHDLLRGAKAVHDAEQVIEHRPAGDRMQHLVNVGLHARSLARGKDHGGKWTMGCHDAPVVGALFRMETLLFP